MEIAPIFVGVLMIGIVFFGCFAITTALVRNAIREKLSEFNDVRYSVTMKFNKNDDKWGYVIIDNVTGETASSESNGSTWHTFFHQEKDAIERCKLYNQYGVK